MMTINPPKVMRYMHYNDFNPSVGRLKRKGGRFQKAANTIDSILGRISREEIDPFHGIRKTKSGEKRIKKCVKYDLNNNSRLVLIVNEGITLFLFAGDHVATDKWIEKNSGFDLVANGEGQIEPIRISSVKDKEIRVRSPRGWSEQNLVILLGESVFDDLADAIGLKPNVIRKLAELNSSCEETDLEEIVDTIQPPESAVLVWDVFSHLRSKNSEAAIKRIDVWAGNLTPIDSVPEEEIPDYVDTQFLKTIPQDSTVFATAFKRFAETSDYKDWMLFMHPDQEKIADANFEGSAKLTGVSGAGKTCIVVRRAATLAKRYPEERVLVLTLNRPLAGLIRELISTYAAPEDSERIDVFAFFELCREYLRTFEPGKDRIHGDTTSVTREWHWSEHIDEIWRIFYRCELNTTGGKILQPLHDSLISRGINAEQYIREEFDWIRSVVPEKNQKEIYLGIPRTGRFHALDERYRHFVIDGLSAWRKQMTKHGAIDHLGIAAALHRHIDKIKPSYRNILVDESQDFGTLELELIRKLTAENKDDLFLVGDAAQHVTWKHQSLRKAGINIPGARSQKIRKNYRNTKDILKAAHYLLVENMTEEMDENEDFEILDPEFASREGSPPYLFEADNLEEEISSAIAFLESEVDVETDRKGCLAICGYSLFELEKYGQRLGIPILNRETSLGENKLFLSDLEQTKGFEFDVVCIVNINSDIVPNQEIPEKEHFRDLSRLYVAMTRAKTQLVLSYSKKRSSFLDLDEVDQYFLAETWDSVVDEVTHVSLPDRLDILRQDDVETPPISEMTGEQFLYTKDSVGLSLDCVQKIRELIAGKAVFDQQKHPIGWASISSAGRTFDSAPTSRRAWGNSLKEFRSLIERLGIVTEVTTGNEDSITLVCLANSRKYLGSCVAGKRWGKGVEAKWVRPVSNRIGGEIPSDGTIYQNGEQVKVLDLVKLSIDEAVPSGYQQENILVTKYGWEKVGRAEWEMLQSLVDDDRSPLWPDSGNRTDRIPVGQALKLDSSLRLIYVENLKISVAMNGYKQQLRAKFQHHKISYNLAITDRAVEKKYLSRPHDEHLLSTAYLCISIAEPFKGYCYKIVASVIEPSTQIN